MATADVPLLPGSEYNKVQTALGMAFVAYASNAELGSLDYIQRKTTEKLNQFFASEQTIKLLGRWELVVWGVSVAQAKLSKTADSTMFVVKSVDLPSLFFISVCGTNPISIFSWAFQDFDLSPVPFDSNATEKGLISRGTKRGVDLLLNMRSSDDNITLLHFLKHNAVSSGPIHIIITGHSLGGALSPCLALFLDDNKYLWNGSESFVETIPFAGPTSGIRSFAKYFDRVFGGRVTRIWNPLDVATSAWDTDKLRTVSSIYSPHKTPAYVRLAVKVVCKVSSTYDYTHIQSNAPPLPASVRTNYTTFFEEIVYQHTIPYFTCLGILELIPIIIDLTPLFKEVLQGQSINIMEQARNLAHKFRAESKEKLIKNSSSEEFATKEKEEIPQIEG